MKVLPEERVRQRERERESLLLLSQEDERELQLLSISLLLSPIHGILLPVVYLSFPLLLQSGGIANFHLICKDYPPFYQESTTGMCAYVCSSNVGSPKIDSFQVHFIK